MLHALNTVLRHMEQYLGQHHSLCFKFIRFIAKNFGTRRNKNFRHHYLQSLRNSGRWVKGIQVQSLTGVRFLEIVNSVDKMIVQLSDYENFILSFNECQELQIEFQKMTSDPSYKWLKVDLYVLMLLNVSHFQICYKSIVDPSAKINSYKEILLKFVAIFRLDAEEVFDLLHRPQDLPFFEKFYSPSLLQLEILEGVSEFSTDERKRAISILDHLKSGMIESILRTNATLITFEFDGLLNNAQLHNNSCERSFGQFKYVESTKENLGFLFKETVVLATTNKFFEWFEAKTEREQSNLMNMAKTKNKALMTIIKANASTEDEIRLKQSKEREEFNILKKSAQKNKASRLTEELFHCIPATKSQYQLELQKFSKLVTGADTERKFIELNLKLQKIKTMARKLPAKSFTVSERGEKVQIDTLREKLLYILQ